MLNKVMLNTVIDKVKRASNLFFMQIPMNKPEKSDGIKYKKQLEIS